MGIIFRDRSLKKGETSNWHCNDCGQDILGDFVHSHKCNPIVKALYEEPMEIPREY